MADPSAPSVDATGQYLLALVSRLGGTYEFQPTVSTNGQKRNAMRGNPNPSPHRKGFRDYVHILAVFGGDSECRC